jgi:hypothetical protein
VILYTDWDHFLSGFLPRKYKLNEIPQHKREIYDLVHLIKNEFPILLFDIKVNLLIHFVEEIEFASVQVTTRWMFWFERLFVFLKRSVHQRT